MSVKRDALYMAIAGKAIERGLAASIQDGHVLIEYGPSEDKATDHLHKQVIRNLVTRLTPTAECHLNSTLNGFKVTVDIPSSERMLPVPEWVTELSPEEKLEMIRQLVA
jgi:hypothetical protein